MRWALAIAVILGSVWGVLGTDVEATLGIVKPDCVSGGHLESIRNQVRASGFAIEAEKQIRLSSAEAEEFYAEHSGRGFFGDLIGFMTSGPVWVLKLVKKNAVAEWRSLIGPTNALQARASHPESIRAKFGSDVQRNCVHGSDSGSSAARELAFFFGSETTDQHSEL